MIIVVDVNIIISALIRDSTTRELIVKSDQEFCFPEISIKKIKKYENLIIKKSELSNKDFFNLLNYLFKFIRIVPTEEIAQNLSEAERIMKNIDPEDVVFIATALCNENSIIWSDDKDFDKQKQIINLKTIDMVKLFSFEENL